MRYTHTGTKFVVTNAEKTLFFAFGGPVNRRWSATVDSLVEAELFPVRQEAVDTIEIGKTGHWGAINEDQLYFVAPVELAVCIEIPAPAPASNAWKGSSS